ncbi:MAG TPA: P-type conjugative transfer protein TrbG [Paraburkholderia sp.]|uniref:P-type conjugative transfer protein TrbG n=1 Tax=Paraburkholderia sp. TaxID=1926495 RepID=UPI002ED0EA56
MRPVLVLTLACVLAPVAHAADKQPIVPSINEVMPTSPTVTVADTAAKPQTDSQKPTTPSDTAPWANLGLPLDLALPVSHAKSPREHAADKAFDKEKDAFDTRQRARIAEYIGKATEHPTTARSAGSATVYGFREGDIYVVYAGLDRLTDIALQPGEALTAEPVAGDTEGWIKSEFTSGTGPNARTHIVIKPRDEGIATNLLVPTTKRVYQLELRSKPDWYMPGVRWFYPDEETAAALKKEIDEQVKQDSSEALAVSPEHLNFRYRIKGRDVSWKPSQVFDDGAKVYLKMPEDIATGDAPALFVIEEGKPLLVNYRIKDRLYIVDRLFAKAQLRVGDKQIDVERCGDRAWFCR